MSGKDIKFLFTFETKKLLQRPMIQITKMLVIKDCNNKRLQTFFLGLFIITSIILYLMPLSLRN